MLLCTKCRTEKDEDEFYTSKSKTFAGRQGFTYWCRSCYAQNYTDNRERQKESNRRASIHRRYGLTLEEYNALVAHGCTICGRNDVRIVMDHCHATNAVRAPLCDGCNRGLGCFEDSPSRLIAAADYLERHATA